MKSYQIVTIETPELGDRSYLLISNGEAAVVDPQRDVDRVLDLLEKHGVELTHVLETHVHNDYVSGGLELAKRTSATYVISSSEPLGFEHSAAQEGDEFKVGSVVVEAMHTPGHTPDHVSYVVIENGEPVAVFTGGSMLFGSVGRTDLLGEELTSSLTEAQFLSVRRIGDELPGHAGVHPTHGFGSFCSSTQTSGSEQSSIERERAANIAFRAEDLASFVDAVTGGLTAYPRYYEQMAPINRSGPTQVDLSPPEGLEATAVRELIREGAWVLDLRARDDFARGHLAGTISLQIADSFATYLGWTLPWGTPVALLGEDKEQLAAAQRQMVRIGIDRPAGAVSGGLETWLSGETARSYRSATFAELADELTSGQVHVLDVRRQDEWDDGHISSAIHVPLEHLQDRLDDLPEGELWVHCASGYRAALAASLLDRAGHDLVAVDDDWSNATELDALRISKK